jgi:hypothetical protein
MKVPAMAVIYNAIKPTVLAVSIQYVILTSIHGMYASGTYRGKLLAVNVPRPNRTSLRGFPVRVWNIARVKSDDACNAISVLRRVLNKVIALRKAG